MKRVWQNENGAVKLSRLNPKLLVPSLGIALGIVLVIYALDAATTGDETAKLPPAIERIDPVLNATQILSQDRVFVDLRPGYTGVLVINGVQPEVFNIGEQEGIDVPGKQLSLPPDTVFEPGNNTLSFQPTDGALIEQFNTGLNTATVRYWRIVDGEAKALSFTWSFVVV